MAKRIAVYCGAALGDKDIYQEKIAELGMWLADEGYELVYGGGKAGLMGVLADAVLASGGKVTGVMPRFLAERELAHPRLTEMIFTVDMSERKKKMIELADVCLAFPGGPGTLEEISEAFSWARIGQNQNPCIFYDVNDYYRLLADFFDHMLAEGFVSQRDREKLLFSASLTEIKQFIQSYVQPQIRTY